MRTVAEWQGRTDDSAPSDNCKKRIVERQHGKCALSGQAFRPSDKIEYDHITPLWLGGQNAESNLQAVLGDPHKRKTQAEASVKAKIDRIAKKHLGITKPKSALSNSKFKKRMDGSVVDRRTGEILR